MKWVYAFILFVLFSMPSGAHVPLIPSPGNNLSSAVLIPDPEKTFAIYGELHYPGEADCYRLELNANQMLELQLSVPDTSFMPSLVIMGPGIGIKNVPPDKIKAPEGSGVIVLPGIKPENAWYEPFSPMSIYQVSNYSLPAGSSGSYYIAIYSQNQSGAYTLATGSLEEFSPSEWIMVPLDLIEVRLWQGQTLLLIFGPMIVIIVVGILILWSNKRRRSTNAWLAAISGLTFLGTSATIAVQTAIALRSAPVSSDVLVTMIFLAASLLLGLASVFLSAREWSLMARAAMLAIGVIGLVFWSGLIIGPMLAFLAAVAPHNMARQSPSKSLR